MPDLPTLPTLCNYGETRMPKGTIKHRLFVNFRFRNTVL